MMGAREDRFRDKQIKKNRDQYDELRGYLHGPKNGLVNIPNIAVASDVLGVAYKIVDSLLSPQKIAAAMALDKKVRETKGAVAYLVDPKSWNIETGYDYNIIREGDEYPTTSNGRVLVPLFRKQSNFKCIDPIGPQLRPASQQSRDRTSSESADVRPHPEFVASVERPDFDSMRVQLARPPLGAVMLPHNGLPDDYRQSMAFDPF